MGNQRRVRARMSPLAFFVQACRAELRRRRPEVEVSPTVLSDACAERWRHTSPKERALFEHLSRVDKMRWERERGAPDGRGRPRKDRQDNAQRWERERGAPEGRGRPRKHRQKNAQESGAPVTMIQREEAHGGNEEATLFHREAPKEARGLEAAVGSPMGQWVGDRIDTQGRSRPWPSKERKEVQTYKDKKHPKESHREQQPGTSKGNQIRPPRDPRQPKRPLNAFLLYSAEHKDQVRSEWPSLNYAEALKKLGEYWAKLSPEQRRPFEIRAAALRKKYGADLAAYQVKNRELAVEKAVASAKGGFSQGEEKAEVTPISHSREPKNEDGFEGLQTSTQLMSREQSEEMMNDVGGEEASHEGALDGGTPWVEESRVPVR